MSCIEASALALEHLSRNAELNGVSDRVEPTHGDAFAELESLREQGTKFDVVVVDPPAFIKRRKDVRAGQQGYRRLNQLAMQLLSREGILISCSCSSYLHNERFTELLLRSARHLERSLQILEFGGQGPDHPVHPAIPETAYLKAWFTRVLPV